MCKAAKIGASEIGGALILLQLWARDRFPHIAPQRLLREHIEPFVDIEGQPLPRGPLGIRWRDDLNAQGVATHAVTSYRYMLDRQKPSQTSSLARIRELAEPESEIFTIACAALALDSSTSTTTTPQPIATPSTSTTPPPEPFVTQSTTTNVAPSTSTTTTS
ncbi:putative Serine/threonine-protein phosphatase 7 long form [Fagus crenata]